MMQHSKILLVGAVVIATSVSSAFGGPLTTDYKSATISFAAGSPVTSGVYDRSDPYTIGANSWVANLLPVNVTYLAGTAGNFFDVLSAAFPTSAGWSYQSAVKPLSDNSLVVRTYDVQGTAARVGAEFHLDYVAHDGDPTTNLHWIQVVTDNHNVTDNKGHGNAENIVDLAPTATSPYYDDGFAATSSSFYDFPGRTDANQSHTWKAQLFLVTGPAAGTPGLITFYGGVEWGWENHPVPEPSSFALLGLGGLGIGVSAYRKRRLAV